ncbi:RIP metalloprotease RseP [Bacteroidales bacterium OttesenSCG-928-B11]|nr:RIP metalloprotease RseP [Bacteroidales bacterium OttesenSCG-928-E04]MDL2308239.1 RIP metalloprotease RseP [Bacteroidales bacterium OttesenSCG-928-C03]MDL2312883.1 RIP metalloprotease RseP [Bacteroidales bacterium OttesenSCG-928-B11]MDL2326211.1 RIP metalloprotease RseP [Bacteroidales bacterium OttesenSCG-928-A14]
MGVFTQIAGLIISLSFLVFTHELGHYMFARIFKTRVDKFYLFFNPGFSLIRMKRFNGRSHFSFFSKEAPASWAEHPEKTEWGLGWLPLGGYCSINGMVDETTSADELPSEPQSYEFRAKPAWQRFFIIVGGVLTNFISAIVIYAAILFIWGKEEIPLSNATFGLQFSDVALSAGFEDGDKIVSVDGKTTEKMSDLVMMMLLDDTKEVTVNRNGELIEIPIPSDFDQQVLASGDNTFITYNFPFVIAEISNSTPASNAGLETGDSIVSINGNTYISFFGFQRELRTNKNQEVTLELYRNHRRIEKTVQLDDSGLLGVRPKGPFDLLPTEKIEYSFFASIPAGIQTGVGQLKNYVKQFKLIATKEGVKQLGGFGTIGSIFPKTWNWEMFWGMTAFLAIILAFMNILPIPALDGGYILFILVEMITRRKPSDKFIGYANMIGLSLLIILVLYANGMDILRWIGK